ncbi:type I restriction-modification system subunit M [Peptoniphilus asaccharolyticus]
MIVLAPRKFCVISLTREGSGSLLLKAEKILGRDKIRNGFYGQEINITTYNLCRINMFLHDIGFDKFNIACEDTLIAPAHWDDEPFELIVSNPPYSIKWVGDENPLLINDPRFAPAGVLAPKSKADLAFIMHSLSWLASNGTAAIVCFPGIMYRGGAEKKIRKYLIDNNYIDCIIQLPPNLFFGTSIATCIMVMKKNKADNKTLFIDASNEYIKVTNNNKLTADNMDKIVNCFANRSEIAHFSHLATYDEISENDYNLSVSTYVEAEDTREKIDIVKLNAEIKEIVAREEALRKAIDEIITEIEVQ